MYSGRLSNLTRQIQSARGLLWTAALLLSTAGCVSRTEREAKPAPPHIDQVSPHQVMAGEPFQAQPGGHSALAIAGTSLRRGARVRLNGQPLETAWGDGTRLSALVPKELTAEPGMYPVTVETPEGQLSNALPLFVLPRTGPAPEIAQLYPAEAEAGKPFNEQPGGLSALGVTGRNFLPNAVLLINGEAQPTSFGGTDQLGCIVPAKLMAHPAELKIVVRNADGKESAAAVLRLTAPAVK
jgi:hypothetical protein